MKENKLILVDELVREDLGLSSGDYHPRSMYSIFEDYGVLVNDNGKLVIRLIIGKKFYRPIFSIIRNDIRREVEMVKSLPVSLDDVSSSLRNGTYTESSIISRVRHETLSTDKPGALLNGLTFNFKVESGVLGILIGSSYYDKVFLTEVTGIINVFTNSIYQEHIGNKFVYHNGEVKLVSGINIISKTALFPIIGRATDEDNDAFTYTFAPTLPETVNYEAILKDLLNALGKMVEHLNTDIVAIGNTITYKETKTEYMQ